MFKIVPNHFKIFILFIFILCEKCVDFSKINFLTIINVAGDNTLITPSHDPT